MATKIKTRNAGQKLPDGSIVPESLELSVRWIDGKVPKNTTVVAFGHAFEDIEESEAKDLLSLEREGVLYAAFWDEASQTFPRYRIKMMPAEIYEYVEATVADHEFLALLEKVGDEEVALEVFPKKKYVERLRSYPVPDFGGMKPKYWICRAAFYGPELESLVCGARPERYEKLDWMPTSPTELLETILQSVCVASRSLSHRRAGRPAFELVHEFDLQDLLYVVIKSVFHDARVEEFTLKHAGTQKRIDIVVPVANSVVETKLVRDREHSRTVCDEVKVDIESYHVHPSCGILWVLLFDPNGFLMDPQTIERDLSGSRRIGNREFTVRIFVKGS
jgi:hypothetical protein